MTDLDAIPIPEVFVKEEPKSPIDIGVVTEPDTSENAVPDCSSPHAGPSNDSGDDTLSRNILPQTGSVEDDQLSNVESESEFSYDESYAAFNVEAQLGNLSDDSSGQNDESLDFDDSLDYVESDHEYSPPKLPRKYRKPYLRNPELERNFECPLCLKRFLTSSAMNGHVAKLHRTTLGDKYVCHLCGAPGSSRSSLKRHLIRTHKVAHVEHPELLTKKCPHCTEGFAALTLLYNHVRDSHQDQVHNYFQCKFCPALIRSKASFLRHVKRAHPGEEDLCTAVETCSVCKEPFTNLHLLQKHRKDQHPELTKHQCDSCDAIFKYPSMLVRHKLSHENPEKYREFLEKRKLKHVCEYCERKFNSKVRLETHVKNFHTNPPEKRVYSCRMCGMTFPTAKMNNKHYRRVHRPERQKIHCGKCNITFDSREECDRHRALHPATCQICQKQFLRRDSLREHLLIHSAPRHQCPHCDKKFTQRSNLKRHIRVHTGEKPYKCNYCNRGFSDKSACNSHMRVHTGYERSVCAICGVSFSKKQRLNYHMRIHSGQGLLHCPLCQRPCTSSYSFRKHVESHQMFLAKSLRSMELFPADPEFVANVLQTLIQVTLNESGHKTRETRPFINKVVDQSSIILKSETPENKSENFNENEETSVAAKNQIEDEEPEVSVKKEPMEEDSSLSLDNEGEAALHYYGSLLEECVDNLDEDSQCTNMSLKEEGADFSLVKFFQILLEKEALRAASTKKRVRKKKPRLEDVDVVYSSSQVADQDDEDSYEGTIEQCLEIVMSDEDQDEPIVNDFPQDDHDPLRINGEQSDHLRHSTPVLLNVSDIKCEKEDFLHLDTQLLECDKLAHRIQDNEYTLLTIKNEPSDCRPLEKDRNKTSPLSNNVSQRLHSSGLDCEFKQNPHLIDSVLNNLSNPVLKIPKLKISRNDNHFVAKFMKDSSS